MTSLKLSSTMEDMIKAAGAADPCYTSIMEAVLAESDKVSWDAAIEDGLIFVKGRWYVPDSRELKHKIFQAEHDSRVAGHFGQFKTLGNSTSSAKNGVSRVACTKSRVASLISTASEATVAPATNAPLTA